MEGISKERLIEIIKHTPFLDISELIDECAELNPWLPINENTPKDRPLPVIFHGGEFEVARLVDDEWINNDNLDYGYGSYIPAYWQELPEDPK